MSRREGAARAGGFTSGGSSAGERGRGEDLPPGPQDGQGRGPSCLQRRREPGDPPVVLSALGKHIRLPSVRGSGPAGAGCGGLSWVAPAPCSALYRQLRRPRSPGEPRGCARGRAGGEAAVPPSAGFAASPGTAGSGTESGALLSCAVPWKGPVLPRASRLCRGVNSSRLPCAVRVTWGEGGRPGALPASCGMWHSS